MIATGERTQATSWAGRLEREKIFSGFGLGAALLMSAVLNCWNLTQNGYDNLYYSVAVQSMMQSWHNFFFAAYDAGGFISVDKPPVALWLQTLSAKLLGFGCTQFRRLRWLPRLTYGGTAARPPRARLTTAPSAGRCASPGAEARGESCHG